MKLGALVRRFPKTALAGCALSGVVAGTGGLFLGLQWDAVRHARQHPVVDNQSLNAFVHAFASARLASWIGIPAARFVGDMKEVMNGIQYLDSRADTVNNHRGLEVVKDKACRKGADYAARIASMMAEGRLAVAQEQVGWMYRDVLEERRNQGTSNVLLARVGPRLQGWGWEGFSPQPKYLLQRL